MPEVPNVSPPIGLAGPNQQYDHSTTRPKNAIDAPRVYSTYRSVSKHVEKHEKAAVAREAARHGEPEPKAPHLHDAKPGVAAVVGHEHIVTHRQDMSPSPSDKK